MNRPSEAKAIKDIEGGLSISGKVSPEVFEIMKGVKFLIDIVGSPKLKESIGRHLGMVQHDGNKVEIKLTLNDREVAMIMNDINRAALYIAGGLVVAGAVMGFSLSGVIQ